MQKSALRKIYLDKRKSLSPTERKQKSEQIAELFFANFDLAKIKFLHCFLPIERFGEIDTKLIIHKIWEDFPQIRTLVPRVDAKTNELENLIFTPATELVQNAWLIHEPAHDETVEAAEIDLVLVPLLCFDEKGFRVGYGKGYYDRLLNKCRADCLKIGVSYFAPVAEIEDVHDFDAPIDFCITPEKIFKAKGKR